MSVSIFHSRAPIRGFSLFSDNLNANVFCILMQVYVAEMQAEVSVCAKRNTHKRTQREIEKVQ